MKGPSIPTAFVGHDAWTLGVPAESALAWLTLFLVVGTAGLAWFTYRLWRETAQAVAGARGDAEMARAQALELFQAERRAWVRASPRLTGPLQRDGTRGMIDIEITLENIGLSPAFDVMVQWVPDQLNWFVNREEMRAVMEGARENRPSELGGRCIFPGRANRQTYVATGEIVDPDGDVVPVQIISWVQYRLTSGGRLHYTSFVWDLTWTPDPDNGAPIPDRTQLGEAETWGLIVD